MSELEAPERDEREVFSRWLAEELSSRLTTADGAPMPFEQGPLAGPIDDRDVGCVWFEGARPHARAGILGENYYRVRVFRRWRQDLGARSENETKHLAMLRLQAALEAALRANLQSPPGHDYFIVREVSPDYTTDSIEAQLTAFCDNPTSAGG